jgi:hypothetical protein
MNHATVIYMTEPRSETVSVYFMSFVLILFLRQKIAKNCSWRWQLQLNFQLISHVFDSNCDSSAKIKKWSSSSRGIFPSALHSYSKRRFIRLKWLRVICCCSTLVSCYSTLVNCYSTLVSLWCSGIVVVVVMYLYIFASPVVLTVHYLPPPFCVTT